MSHIDNDPLVWFEGDQLPMSVAQAHRNNNRDPSRMYDVGQFSDVYDLVSLLFTTMHNIGPDVVGHVMLFVDVNPMMDTGDDTWCDLLRYRLDHTPKHTHNRDTAVTLYCSREQFAADSGSDLELV
jgi:hypothetical protein